MKTKKRVIFTVSFWLKIMISFAMVIYLVGCKKTANESSVTPVPKIKDLHTNGTMIVVSKTKVKGYMFIVDEKGNAINGITSANIQTKLSWNSTKSTNSDTTSGLIMIHPNNQTELRVGAAITMDYSGSMWDSSATIPNLEKGVLRFIHSMHEGDQGEIIKFDHRVLVVQGFTGDTSYLANAVRHDDSLGGNTALFQSIYQGLQDASPLDTSQYLRSIVAFTDGGENASTISLDDMLAYAIIHGIPINTIGFLTRATDTALLKEIAQRSGGFYFFTSNSSMFNQIYSTISGQLTNSYSYSVTWQGTMPPSGTEVTATITTTYQGFKSSFQYTYTMP